MEARGWVARVAAPIAFLLAATIGVLLVRSALESDSAPVRTEVVTPPPAAEPPAITTEPPTTEPEPQYYVIESGDTLASVADDYETTVERLLELNPGIDPVALSVGQRIRVG